MADERLLLLLNLDAEQELAQPDRKGASAMMQTRIHEQARAILDDIQRWRPGTEILWPGERGAPTIESDCVGTAWCPTPSAIRQLEEAGATASAPPFEILRRVNHRAFAAGLPATANRGLPGAFFSTDADEVIDRIGSHTQPKGWLLKRAFSFAGRWRKVLATPPDKPAATWIRASMTGEYGVGLQVEPVVDRVLDVACHGSIGADGKVQLFRPRTELCNEDGHWLGSHPLDDEPLIETLRTAAHETANALKTEGYFGPFAIDGFVWLDEAGRRRTATCSDINARFSMDWWRAAMQTR